MGSQPKKVNILYRQEQNRWPDPVGHSADSHAGRPSDRRNRTVAFFSKIFLALSDSDGSPSAVPNYHLIVTPSQAPILEIVNSTKIAKQMVKIDTLKIENCLVENEFWFPSVQSLPERQLRVAPRREHQTDTQFTPCNKLISPALIV